MNQQILMLVLVVVVIGVISAVVMMSNSPETYTAASDFNPSKDIFIPGMKADGTIVLTHKFKDIDTAIDKAAGKIKTDYAAADVVSVNSSKAYTNTKLGAAQHANIQTFQTKAAMAGYYTKAQSDGRYIMKAKDYKMLVAGGPHSRKNSYVLARGGDGLLQAGGSSGRAFRFLDMKKPQDYAGGPDTSNMKLRVGGTGANYNDIAPGAIGYNS